MEQNKLFSRPITSHCNHGCVLSNTLLNGQTKGNSMKKSIKGKVIAYLFGCSIGLAISYGIIIPVLNAIVR